LQVFEKFFFCYFVELTKKLGNKIEVAALHVIGKKVLEEIPSNPKILTKWQNRLFMERIQNEHVTMFSS
jgi:hypothetical protein